MSREAKTATATNETAFHLKTSSKKTIYLKVYLIKKFKKVYFNFTVQDHEDAYNLLREEIVRHRSIASKYKLKKAIYELGPTGFPFERFIAAILASFIALNPPLTSIRL